MAYNRADIRSEVRVDLFEPTADLWADADLNSFIAAEIRSLPRKGIYLEKTYTFTTIVNDDNFALPSNVFKVEKIERNWGTSALPDWVEVKGYDFYNNALYFPSRVSTAYDLRLFWKQSFTVPTDDVTASDIPDEKMEVVIAGCTRRAYKKLLSYFLDTSNWDTIAKPDGISLNQALGLYKEAKDDYQKLIQQYKTVPRPRDIDLTG